MDILTHKCYNPQIRGFYYKKESSKRCRYCRAKIDMFDIYMPIDVIDSLNKKIFDKIRFEMEQQNSFDQFFNVTQPLQVLDYSTAEGKYVPTELDIFYKPIVKHSGRLY